MKKILKKIVYASTIWELKKYKTEDGRLTQQAETIDDLTMRLSEAEALLNIARGEGGS